MIAAKKLKKPRGKWVINTQESCIHIDIAAYLPCIVREVANIAPGMFVDKRSLVEREICCISCLHFPLLKIEVPSTFQLQQRRPSLGGGGRRLSLNPVTLANLEVIHSIIIEIPPPKNAAHMSPRLEQKFCCCLRFSGIWDWNKWRTVIKLLW